MTRFLHTAAIAMMLALFALLPATAQDAKDPLATAAAVLDHMDAGDFEAASTDFNSNLKGSISAVQLAGVQMQLESAGAVQSRGEAQVSEQQGHTVVAYRIQREHAAIIATIALDSEGKVAGLHFAPADAP